MDLTKIYKEIESIPNDKDKILFIARIITYIEDLSEHIGFQSSDINYINVINTELKLKITKILENIKGNFVNEIEFLMYYNNENRHNNRHSRNC